MLLQELPVLQQGQTFVPESISMEDGETGPPALLSESDLLTLMDRNGIGSPSSCL